MLHDKCTCNQFPLPHPRQKKERKRKEKELMLHDTYLLQETCRIVQTTPT